MATSMNAAQAQPHLDPPAIFKILADGLRWSLLRALAVSDRRVQELAALVAQPTNLVSYHLKRLRDDRLVTTRRSDADGRDIYYALDLDALRVALQEAALVLHPGLDWGADTPALQHEAVRVLFVCTHNSARSQMAEGLLRHLGGPNVTVASAGTTPRGVHPDAITTMDAFGIDIRAQRANNLARYEQEAFDYVITVCDLARETCPTFPGGGQQLHWSLPDPAAIESEAERQAAFQATADQLQSRITHFLYGIAR